MLLFDSSRYIDQLGWLGRTIATPAGSVLLRRFGGFRWDARGSWPYQSLPTIAQLRALRDLSAYMPLSFTTAIRPDTDPGATEAGLATIRGQFRAEYRALKVHLGHSPLRPPARDAYSRRTRRRLNHAAGVFFVAREDLTVEHAVMAGWQRRVKELRSIADASSPDPAHFAGLIASFGGRNETTACVALRRRDAGTLAGVFLLFADLSKRSWHAHSFLMDPDALRDFGSYLLFDRTLEILGERPVWFGGAPSGGNGDGVFVFKRRFANVTGQAHILSVDLNDAGLAKVRSDFRTYSWLPDYRVPDR
jgi:hypothetical protein